MKNILVLFASPHKQGKTAALLNIYLEQYLQTLTDSCNVDILPVFDQHVLPCVGCNMCIKSCICPQNKKDDVKKIFDCIFKSDHVIVASPVYFSGFPSPLKALIDRAQQLYNNKARSGKVKNLKIRTGALIATCGSDNKNSFIPLKDCCKQFFDCLDVDLSNKLYAVNTDNLSNIKIYNEN